MKTTKTIYLLSLGLILGIFLINVVSAQTLVAGKIYNSNFDDVIVDAYVTVTCNLDTLTTNTLGDGTYAVRFNVSECNKSDEVKVTASKTGFSTKTVSGEVKQCDKGDANCGEDSLFAIVNLGLGTGSSNTGRHSGRYYLCGNNQCDTGETTTTCPGDCKPVVNTTTQTTNTTTNSETNNGNNGAGQTQAEQIQNQTTTQGRLSGITGAVVGTLGAGWIVIIIFIVGVLGLSLVVRFIRNRKTITETIQ